MSISIEISWWIIPAIITLIAFGWAHSASSGGGGGDSYSQAGQGIAMVLYFAAAAIPSLIAWLIWAVIT